MGSKPDFSHPLGEGEAKYLEWDSLALDGYICEQSKICDWNNYELLL